MKRFLLTLFLFPFSLWATESISSLDESYLEICTKVTTDPWYFENFRSLAGYNNIVTLDNAFGKTLALNLLNTATPEIKNQCKHFECLDLIGNPEVRTYPELGKLSATTLRYIVIAKEIKNLFDLPEKAQIAEIGAGFGGQCYILSKLFSLENYYIYDLPEVNGLIHKVLDKLKVENVIFLPLKARMNREFDLLISNFSFSECKRPLQIEYFNKVIRKSKRGYITYNEISHLFGLDSMSSQEFFDLLHEEGFNPKIREEPINTHKDNVVIIWDRTLPTSS